MKILMTGFKPFLNEKINPSELLSVALSTEFKEVESLILPVEFSRSFEVLKKHLDNHEYDYVILMGQAAGRSKISLEKIALNWVHTEHRDEGGVVPTTGPLFPGEDLALMSKFPVELIYENLKKENSIEISFSAGTFVCNDLYYRTIQGFKETKSVFIHLPLVKEQVAVDQTRPYLEFEVQKKILADLLKKLMNSGRGY